MRIYSLKGLLHPLAIPTADTRHRLRRDFQNDDRHVFISTLARLWIASGPVCVHHAIGAEK